MPNACFKPYREVKKQKKQKTKTKRIGKIQVSVWVGFCGFKKRFSAFIIFVFVLRIREAKRRRQTMKK